MSIEQLLKQVTKQFEKADIASARLDATVLLADTLGQNTAWLLAHLHDQLPEQAQKIVEAKATARARRQPLAYILGRREFYGRDFMVTPQVLIPRPETEEIIEQLKQLSLAPGARLLDVGTGSGAIAITAALEIPGELHVEANDISLEALDIARLNADMLGATIERFFVSDLLAKADTYDVIAANLPYVGHDWLRSPETNHEPALALFAENGGLALIAILLKQVPKHLARGGYVVLEADPRQFDAIVKLAPPSLQLLKTKNFVLVFQKT